MKRYVLSPVILGSGSVNDANRAAATDVPQTIGPSILPTSPEPPYGPLWLFTLSHVNTNQLASVEAVSNAYVFPEYPLAGRLDGMESGTRTAMLQTLAAYDLDGEGTHFDLSGFGDASAFQDLILGLVQQLDPAITSLSGFNPQEVIE